MDEVNGGFKVFNGEQNHSHLIEETSNNNGSDLAPSIEKTLEQNQTATKVIRLRKKKDMETKVN
ncbi:hypothetical protein FRX31_024841 [Thalictrum thalictroides]|uniref:Uncharacterized protein n=1 Tax=Thalictrum thalictroides TaxID=46969 RepID=A0A7J6VML2_THATH|nr:hypothetical protein FRX31_024841 [Thalictrum thalictroides]